MININESVFNYMIRGASHIRMKAMGWAYSRFSLGSRSARKILIGYNFRARNSRLIYFGRQVKVGDNCRFECFPEHSLDCANLANISVGGNSNFGNNVHIGAIGKIVIGKNCLTGSNILIIDHNHGSIKEISERRDIPPKDRTLQYKGSITIEENVWLCDGVVVLGGSVIKRGSTVPVNTVVSGFFDNLGNG